VPERRRATRSVLPWLTHRRMIPKWVALVAAAALAFARGPAPHAGWLLLAGLLAFFPSEYLVHRGVFHFFADKRAGAVVSRQHVEHHRRPDDLDFLFNNPLISVGVGVLYFLVALAVSRSVAAAAAFSLGNFAGLLYYEHVHFTAHRPGSRPWTPWSRRMKRFHLWHHYKHERLWFGVTSPLFDRAFGSDADPSQVPPSATVRTLVPTAEQQEWMRR